MSYNSELQNNNADLRAILDAVNALPEAGSGETPDPVIQELTVTKNGTYTAPDGIDGYSPVTVEVPIPDPVLQEKSVTPSKSFQTVTPDSSYDGLSKVNVGAIPDEYIVTDDATAEDGDILLGETAYVDGVKVTGTFSLDSELTTQDDLISKIQAAVDSLPEAGGGNGDTRFADLVTGTITTVDDSTITTLRAYAFYGCKDLVTVKLSKARIGASSVFRECSNLQSADLPELAGTSGGSLFLYCSNLKSVNMPKVTALSTYVFQYCTSLTKLDLGNITSISGGAFKDSGLETLIIRTTRTTPPSLSSTNPFEGTPIGNGDGHIYVPTILVDNFKSATNWSNYAAQIRAIEDYPDICG